MTDAPALLSPFFCAESLGFWRAGAELRKIHFAEEWNELHHLQARAAGGGRGTSSAPPHSLPFCGVRPGQALRPPTMPPPQQIMEALGGDLLWFDRFVAEHAALLYYWVCIGFYMLAPRNAYQFSELVEWHAVDTYAQARARVGVCVWGGEVSSLHARAPRLARRARARQTRKAPPPPWPSLCPRARPPAHPPAVL